MPRCTAFNAAGRLIAEVPPEHYVGKTAKELFDGESGEVLYRLHVEAFQSTEPTTSDYKVVINGRERYIRTVLTPVLDDGGKVVQVIGTPIDVTAEHLVENIGLRSAEVNREMEALVSLAAHDLRSPMKKVQAIANFLRQDLPELNENTATLLDMLEKVAVQSFEMISDLLSHAKTAEVAEAKPVAEDFELTSISDALSNTLDPEKKHDWQVPHVWINGERVVIQTILRNLIDNSLKHNSETPNDPEQDPTLTLRISVNQLNADQLEFVVSDSGRGFSSAGKNHLETGHITSDSGFGLTGIRRLLASRKGTIQFDDQVEGEGATIRVVLPGRIIRQDN